MRFDLTHHDWRIYASCTDWDAGLFDALDEPGDYPHHAPFYADTVCARCPVRLSCGELADQTQSIGLFGGASRYMDGSEYVTVAHLAGSVTRVPLDEPEEPRQPVLVRAEDVRRLFDYYDRQTAKKALKRWGVPVAHSTLEPGGRRRTDFYRLDDVLTARKAG